MHRLAKMMFRCAGVFSLFVVCAAVGMGETSDDLTSILNRLNTFKKSYETENLKKYLSCFTQGVKDKADQSNLLEDWKKRNYKVKPKELLN